MTRTDTGAVGTPFAYAGNQNKQCRYKAHTNTVSRCWRHYSEADSDLKMVCRNRMTLSASRC